MDLRKLGNIGQNFEKNLQRLDQIAPGSSLNLRAAINAIDQATSNNPVRR